MPASASAANVSPGKSNRVEASPSDTTSANPARAHISPSRRGTVTRRSVMKMVRIG